MIVVVPAPGIQPGFTVGSVFDVFILGLDHPGQAVHHDNRVQGVGVSGTEALFVLGDRPRGAFGVKAAEGDMRMVFFRFEIHDLSLSSLFILPILITRHRILFLPVSLLKHPSQISKMQKQKLPRESPDILQ